MDRQPPQSAQDPPSLVRVAQFSLERLLTHIDPGPPEETEEFVRRIYEQRRFETSPDVDDKTRH